MTSAFARSDGGRSERGVTLIEVMVGLLVGMLATVVIAQVLATAEGQKRTTTNGSDAQTNGALALYTIERDLLMAGYGLTTSGVGLGCPVKAQVGGVNYNWSMVPVQITNGANGAPDTIQTLMSNKPYTVPYKVSQNHPPTAANFFVQSALGVVDGDLMIAVPPVIDPNNWCSVFNVTAGNGFGGGNGNGGNGNGNGQGLNQIIHNSGAGGAWNQSGGQTIFPANGYPAGSYLVNVGQFIDHTYAISADNSLTLTAFSTAAVASTTDELFPQIVQLQAMYGKDTDGNGVVDAWDNTTPTTNAGWLQVIAVRVAVVARSQTYEKEEVTTSNPLWDVGAAVSVAGATTCGASKCLSIDVGAGTAGADARHYRYKTFDVVVPLRNMIWKS